MSDGVVNLSSIVGGAYNEFWHCKKRYRVVKGGRGSKKSCTAALWFIYNMMYYYHNYKLMPNLLVIRRYYNTHRDSTRAQLIWAINRLGVEHLWKIPKSDLTLTYAPSGQKIIFRGLDDPQSITSITVEKGQLCWVWIEEAFQVQNEDDFNKIDMSIRGKLPEPLFHQFTLTLNPWSDRSWIKRRFFDIKDLDTFAYTTTYRQNEFLSDADIALFEKMKEQNPRRYEIEGEGKWGISEGVIYENWQVEEFDIAEIMKNSNYRFYYGMDFGYTDPTAFIACAASQKDYLLYIFDEWCETTMENRKIASTLIAKGYQNAIITADSEDPRTISELKKLGLWGIRPSKKGKGSVLGGIQKLQDYRMIVHPKCTDTIISLSNYSWERDKETGEIKNVPEHAYSHLMDALRYGCEKLGKLSIEL